MPGEKAGSAEPLSPGYCPAAGQDCAFNGGSAAVCGEGEVSPNVMKSSLVHISKSQAHDVVKCNLGGRPKHSVHGGRQYVCVDSGTMVISFFQ